MTPPPPPPSCLRWLPLFVLLATYGAIAVGFYLGAVFSGAEGSSATLGSFCLMAGLVLLLITPILAWVAVRRRQARLLNIAVLTLALFNLVSMFLA